MPPWHTRNFLCALSLHFSLLCFGFGFFFALQFLVLFSSFCNCLCCRCCWCTLRRLPLLLLPTFTAKNLFSDGADMQHGRKIHVLVEAIESISNVKSKHATQNAKSSLAEHNDTSATWATLAAAATLPKLAVHVRDILP